MRKRRQKGLLRPPRLAIRPLREPALLHPSFEAADSSGPIEHSIHLVGSIPDPRFQLRMHDDGSGTAVLPVCVQALLYRRLQHFTWFVLVS